MLHIPNPFSGKILSPATVAISLANGFLNTVAKPILNAKYGQFGTITELSIQPETRHICVKCKLAGLEDHEIDIVCKSVRLAQDGSSITLADFDSSYLFVKNACNAFAAGEHKIDNPKVKTGVAVLQKFYC